MPDDLWVRNPSHNLVKLLQLVPQLLLCHLVLHQLLQLPSQHTQQPAVHGGEELLVNSLHGKTKLVTKTFLGQNLTLGMDSKNVFWSSFWLTLSTTWSRTDLSFPHYFKEVPGIWFHGSSHMKSEMMQVKPSSL